jgi:S-(hydroxymethyl)glutathione dehydrogenase/alcohol dehydrogenase
MQVRAAVAFAPNEPLAVRELELSPPGEGEVLVQMKASGLCHSDLSVMQGKVPRYTFPIVLGHEGAGVVVECGPEVTSVQPGDHVVPVAVPECRQCVNCTSGRTNLCLQMYAPVPSHFILDGQPITSFLGLATFADHAVISEVRLAKIRRDAALDVACYVGCGVVTGVGSALRTAPVKPGSSVAVFGLGGIGLNVVQGARIAGAARIYGIDTNPRRASIARSLGATDFIDPRSVADVAAHIRSLSGGGVDFSFECIGNIEVMRAALECTNPAWGVAVCVGIPGGGAQMTFDPAMLMTGRTWKGSLLGGEKTRTVVPQLVDWYVNGLLRLDELVTHRLGLEEINRGFEMMRSGEAIRSVVVYSS